MSAGLLATDYFWLVMSIFLMVLVGFHLYNVYQDLYTVERRSVRYRRFPPVITTPYKLVSAATVASVSFFMLMPFSFFFFLASQAGNMGSGCFAIDVISGIFYQLAKLFMYYIFLIRLHLLFGSSTYAYSKRGLIGWALFFTVYVVLVMSLNIADDISSLVSGNNPCALDSPSFLTMVGIILLMFQDIGFSIGFLVAFARSLKRLTNFKLSSNVPKNSATIRSKRKFYYSAVKVAILTAVTVTSTLFSLILAFLLLPLHDDIAILPVPLDMMLNSICLLLMTPYYPDVHYYRKLCGCCICCCSPRNAQYKSEAEQVIVEEIESMMANTSGTGTGTSVDTHDQIRDTADATHATGANTQGVTKGQTILVKSTSDDIL